MIFGMVWNRLKASDGRRGSEFASYGVKHLKVRPAAASPNTPCLQAV
jgi:hypothetical protein